MIAIKREGRERVKECMCICLCGCVGICVFDSIEVREGERERERGGGGGGVEREEVYFSLAICYPFQCLTFCSSSLVFQWS